MKRTGGSDVICFCYDVIVHVSLSNLESMEFPPINERFENPNTWLSSGKPPPGYRPAIVS
jgi:hypothetical protein